MNTLEDKREKLSNEDQITESIFNSIDIIVDDRVKKAPINKVEMATIEQVKGKNRYLVNNGSVKYEAKGAIGTEYKQDDRVHVMIPENNYDEDKIIVGNYLYNTISTLKNIPPSEQFVNMSGNIVTKDLNGDVRTYGLIANGKTYTNPTLAYAKEPIREDYTTSKKDYDTLYIGASFKNNFDFVQEQKSGENSIVAGAMAKGTYGLVLHGVEYNPETKESHKIFCILDTSDMIGDVYNFNSYFFQEKCFGINPKCVYKHLKLQFFQNVIGWVEDDEQNEERPYENWGWVKEENGFKRLNLEYDESYSSSEYLIHQPSKEPDLFVKNIKVCFGYSLDKYEKDTVLLMSEEKQTYSKDDNKRHLKTRWIHFDSEQRPWAIDNLEHKSLEEYTARIRWYREDLEAEEEDEFAGKGWVEIEKEYGDFNCTVGLDVNKDVERFKVLITLDGVRYWSDVLEFTNPAVKKQQELLDGVNIVYPSGDTNQGNFFFYSDIDKSASSGNAGKLRTLETKLEPKDETTKIEYTKGDVLVWLIPSNNTMIRKPEIGKEIDEDNNNIVFLEATSKDGEQKKELGSVIIESREKYHVVAKLVDVLKESDKGKEEREEEVKKSISLNYRLKKNYSDNKNRNTIVCYYYPKGKTKRQSKAETTFRFGTQGTQGSDYTLDIEWTEITRGGKKYENPPAITWAWKNDEENSALYTGEGHEKGNLLHINNVDSTSKLIFTGNIIDKSGNIVNKEKKDNVTIKLSFYKKAGVDGNDFYADKYMELVDNSIVIKDYKKDFPKKKDNEKIINGDLARILPYTLITVKAAYKNISLTKIMPLPIRRYRHIYGINGPDEIIYDASGYNPKLNDDEPYELKERDINSTDAQKDKIELKSWEIKVANANEKEESFYPTLKTEDGRDNKVFLKPANMFISSESKSPDIYSAVGVRARAKNDEVLWAQPIYVHHNQHSIGFINEWKGGMVLDEKNNTVLTSVIGAGEKKGNTFSGVFLGKLTGLGEKNLDSKTGIIGLSKGIKTFSLDTDGVATFGTGNGQIIINGEESYISSAEYESGVKGVKIDMVKGVIHAYSGDIGEWKIENGALRTSGNEGADNGAVLSGSGNIGLSLGVKERDKASTGKLWLMHSGRALFGVENGDSSTAKLDIRPNGEVKGTHWGVTIEGNAYFGCDSFEDGWSGIRINGVQGTISGANWTINQNGKMSFNTPAQRIRSENNPYFYIDPSLGKVSFEGSANNFFRLGVKSKHPEVSGLNVGNEKDGVYSVGMSDRGMHIENFSGDCLFKCIPDAEFTQHIRTMEGINFYNKSFDDDNNIGFIGRIDQNTNGIKIDGVHSIRNSDGSTGESYSIQIVSKIEKTTWGTFIYLRTLKFINGILVDATPEEQVELK